MRKEVTICDACKQIIESDGLVVGDIIRNHNVYVSEGDYHEECLVKLIRQTNPGLPKMKFYTTEPEH